MILEERQINKSQIEIIETFGGMNEERKRMVFSYYDCSRMDLPEPFFRGDRRPRRRVAMGLLV
jgi:hypothetical protein